MRKSNPRLKKHQREALEAYKYASSQEERSLGSVFVTSIGQRDVEAKTRAAFERCKALGLGVEHGL